jgi:hypothetical protein
LPLGAPLAPGAFVFQGCFAWLWRYLYTFRAEATADFAWEKESILEREHDYGKKEKYHIDDG